VEQLLRHGQLVLELGIAAAKLSLQVADGQVRPDAREDLLGLKRFVDEIDGPQLEASHLFARSGERREKDDRGVRGPRVGFEPHARLEAVHLRHHDVEENQIWTGAPGDRERVLASARQAGPAASASDGDTCNS
jgi:hypothetical protein